MKRLVPFVIVSAMVASVVVSCRGCKSGDPVDKLCGGGFSKKEVHQLKYAVTKTGEVKESVDGGCRLPCPSNSPIVNSFPVNGLDGSGLGACNPEQVRVQPGTAGRPNKCADGSLEFIAATGTIAIKNSQGATCAGSDLQDASFTVESVAGHVKLTIKEVMQVPDDPLAPSGSTHEGYRIVATGIGGGTSNVSVCDATRAKDVRNAIGLPPVIGDYSATYGSGSGTGTGTDPDAPYVDYVIAVPGPLYSNNVKPIGAGTNFFNLACATDALAKRTRDKIAKPTDNPFKQYSALRMITAAYCNKPRTSKGMKFHFTLGYNGGSGSGSEDPEAWWTSGGARCLESPRIEEMGSDFKQAYLGSALIPAGCGSDHGHEKCKNWYDWKTQVLYECAHPDGSDDDVVNIADSCSGSGSTSVIGAVVDYKSYLPTDGSNGSSSNGP